MAVIETITGAAIAVVVTIIRSEYNRYREKSEQEEKDRQEVIDSVQTQVNSIINIYNAYLKGYEGTAVPYEKATRTRNYLGSDELIQLKYSEYFDEELAELCREFAGECLELNYWNLPTRHQYDESDSDEYMRKVNSMLEIAKEIDNRLE